jgi:hypothetical protein
MERSNSNYSFLEIFKKSVQFLIKYPHSILYYLLSVAIFFFVAIIGSFILGFFLILPIIVIFSIFSKLGLSHNISISGVNLNALFFFILYGVFTGSVMIPLSLLNKFLFIESYNRASGKEKSTIMDILVLCKKSILISYMELFKIDLLIIVAICLLLYSLNPTFGIISIIISGLYFLVTRILKIIKLQFLPYALSSEKDLDDKTILSKLFQLHIGTYFRILFYTLVINIPNYILQGLAKSFHLNPMGGLLVVCTIILSIVTMLLSEIMFIIYYELRSKNNFAK